MSSLPRRPRKSRRSKGRGFLAAASFLVACSGSASEHLPVAHVAGASESARAFGEIRAAWIHSDATSGARRTALEAFIRAFPRDGLTPMAKGLLAIACLPDEGESDLACADRELRALEDAPPGTLHDLAMTARARRLRRGGHPEEAMDLLRPLSGTMVDPLVRILFQGELSLAATDTGRGYEAISYMDVWLRSATDDERPIVREKVAAEIARLPRDVLEGTLTAMRQQTELGYGEEIREMLKARLAHIAIASTDPTLARALLSGGGGGGGDAGAELVTLAGSKRGVHAVRGRTVGLLLPTSFPALRDESADTLRGVMWALGIPHGGRTFDAELSNVSLVTRDDGGDVEHVDFALDELSGEGASVIIAGIESEEASRALAWSDREKVPVIVLTAAPPNEFGFVLGEAREHVEAALLAAAPALGDPEAAHLEDDSIVERVRSAPGAPARPTLTSCDLPILRAGAPRYPVAEWAARGTKAWVIAGSPSCARDVVAEVEALPKAAIIGLPLESSSSFAHSAKLTVLAASAGLLPVVGPPPGDLGAFVQLYGAPVSWWSALGRDAATLAARALRELPIDETGDEKEIESRRRQVHAALATATAALWTTDSPGFGGAHALPRTLRVVKIPAKGL